MSESALVEIDGLSVSLQGHTVLRGVCLSVAAGSWHALVGPNGAGKSTLLRALLGQLPFEGRITCHWRGAGRIGYVPQLLGIDRGMPLTVRDFLALCEQRGAEALARVGLSGLERRRMSALSGGELRRVLLAQAISPPPELLILDEPGAGVDRQALDGIEQLLARLRDEGTTVLVVTHDLDQVRRLADRVTGLAGAVRFDGPPAEVLTLQTALAAFSPGQRDA